MRCILLNTLLRLKLRHQVLVVSCSISIVSFTLLFSFLGPTLRPFSLPTALPLIDLGSRVEIRCAIWCMCCGNRDLWLIDIKWKIWFIVDELNDLITGIESDKKTLNQVLMLELITFYLLTFWIFLYLLFLMFTIKHLLHFRCIVPQSLLYLLCCCEAHYLNLSDLLLLVELNGFNVKSQLWKLFPPISFSRL